MTYTNPKGDEDTKQRVKIYLSALLFTLCEELTLKVTESNDLAQRALHCIRR